MFLPDFSLSIFRNKNDKRNFRQKEEICDDFKNKENEGGWGFRNDKASRFKKSEIHVLFVDFLFIQMINFTTEIFTFFKKNSKKQFLKSLKPLNF